MALNLLSGVGVFLTSITQKHAKFPITNLFQSLDMEQSSDGVFSFSGFSFKSHLNKKCCDSRTSNEIDMKLITPSKLDKRNRKTSKKI